MPDQWPPMTIRRLMGVVAIFAMIFGLLVYQRVHLQRWEARRSQMYLQRDVTQAMCSEAMAEIASTDRKESEQPNVFIGSGSRTADWSITVNKLKTDGNR